MNFNTFRLPVLLITALLASTLSYGQFAVGIGYQNSTPRGNMGYLMERAGHGIFTDMSYRIPKTKLSVGLQFAVSEYGFQRNQEPYQFANGYEGVVDVEVSNIFTNNSLYLRYDLLDGGFVTPYLFGGAGFSAFSTELLILDPRETFTSDCPKPLETSVLLRERTSYLLFGAGMMLDFGHVIKSQPKDKYFFDLRLGYQNGGDVRFMTANQANPRIGNSQREEVYFDFISEAQPDVVHEYHAGSTYRSAMRFVTLNVGFMMRFGPRQQNGSFWDHIDF